MKDVPTGNLVVTMNAIGQMADGFGKDAKYEADHLIPIRMTVDKSMATDFRDAGYYDGCFTKFTGVVINTVEITEEVEKAAFGTDIVKKVKRNIRRNEIKSGVAVSTIYEHDLTEDVVDTLKSKRKAKLKEIEMGESAHTETAEGFEKNPTPAPATTYNPFLQK